MMQVRLGGVLPLAANIFSNRSSVPVQISDPEKDSYVHFNKYISSQLQIQFELLVADSC